MTGAITNSHMTLPKHEVSADSQLASLADCRSALDKIDGGLLDLLLERAEVAMRVGEIKLETGMPVRDTSREMQILANIAARAEGSTLSPRHAVNVFSGILSVSRAIQEALLAEQSNKTNLDSTG